MRILTCVSVALCSMSCAISGGGLSHAERVGAVTVHAESPELARRIAQAVERSMPTIQTLGSLANRESGHIYVRCQLEGGIDGTTHLWPNRASIDLLVQPGFGSVDALVAHELTHYWLGPTWRRLPGVVEEGLCEVVADQVDPESAPARRAWHAAHLMSAIADGVRLELPVWIDGRLTVTGGRIWRTLDKSQLHLDDRALQLSLEQLASFSSANRSALTSFGYLLASRIGIDRLHEMCLDAEHTGLDTVMATSMFEAAALDASAPASWEPAILSMLDDRGRYALAMETDRIRFNIDAPPLNCLRLQFLDSNGAVTGSATLERAGGEAAIPAGSVGVRLGAAPCDH